jgi:hypothetical protein
MFEDKEKDFGDTIDFNERKGFLQFVKRKWSNKHDDYRVREFMREESAK